MELKEKLIDLRKKKRLTQLELAEELNVSRQAVSRWEVGTAVPSTENFKYLAKLYDVPLEYLLSGDEQEAEKKKTTQDEDQNKTASRGMKIIMPLVIMVLCIVVFFFMYSGAEKKEEVRLNELERSEIEPEMVFNLEW